jgi:hypothetical protein
MAISWASGFGSNAAASYIVPSSFYFLVGLFEAGAWVLAWCVLRLESLPYFGLSARSSVMVDAADLVLLLILGLVFLESCLVLET